MYCQKCGKEIAEDSNFCQHCGEGIASKTQNEMPKEYEYYSYEDYASEDRYFDEVKAYGAAEINRDGLTEAEARLHFWQKHQSVLLPNFQVYIDDGWEPITELGPACLKLRPSSQRKKKGLLANLLEGLTQYWELVGIYVRFRRTK